MATFLYEQWESRTVSVWMHKLEVHAYTRLYNIMGNRLWKQ